MQPQYPGTSIWQRHPDPRHRSVVPSLAQKPSSKGSDVLLHRSSRGTTAAPRRRYPDDSCLRSDGASFPTSDARRDGKGAEPQWRVGGARTWRRTDRRDPEFRQPERSEAVSKSGFAKPLWKLYLAACATCKLASFTSAIESFSTPKPSVVEHQVVCLK